ncbi:bacteriocin-like protein [Chryseobacterium sp. SIMBA_038]|uniref:bacteriocin-like protein n=1 Tax=Chryseobacterium sp. SIMBA_038 TaxID=3085780 RepID=UPI0039798258
MKNLKILSRKELKAIEGAASISKCLPGNYYCPEAAVCVPINAECYIIVPDIPVEG